MQTSPEVKNHIITVGVFTFGLIAGISGGAISLAELLATRAALTQYQATLQDLINNSVNGTVEVSKHVVQEMLTNITTEKAFGTVVNSFEVMATGLGLGLASYGIFRLLRSAPAVIPTEMELQPINQPNP